MNPACYANPAKDTYFCHRCKATGKWSELGENTAVIEEIEKQELDLQFLEKCEAYWPDLRFPGSPKLEGLLMREAETGSIILPVRDFTGSIVGIKKRLRDGGAQRYGAVPGSKAGCYYLPYGQGQSTGQAQSLGLKRLFICEGEFDAISARLLGFKGDILALQSTNLKEDVMWHIRKNYREIYLALDNDSPGRKAAVEIAAQFSSKRVVNIAGEYPELCKDINEVHQRLGHDKASAWLKKLTMTEAEKATFKGASLVPEMLAFLKDRKNTRGVKTGFNLLDDKLGGGLRPGELTIVHAAAKTGKTTFLNQLIFNFISTSNKVALASFEMKAGKEILPSLVSIGLQINVRRHTDPVDLQNLSIIIERELPYLDHLIFYDSRAGSDLDKVEAWLEDLFTIEQPSLVCLDHSLFMLKSPKDSDENLQLYKRLSLLAQKLNTHIVVVVQAPKLQAGQELSLDTTYGGASAGMFTHNFVTLERVKNKPNELKVKLLVARYPGSRPSEEPMLLFYDHEICSLSE